MSPARQAYLDAIKAFQDAQRVSDALYLVMMDAHAALVVEGDDSGDTP